MMDRGGTQDRQGRAGIRQNYALWAMGKESKPREYGLLPLGILDPASSTSLGNLRILVSQGTQDSFLLPWTHTSVSLQSIAIAVFLSSPQSTRNVC